MRQALTLAALALAALLGFGAEHGLGQIALVATWAIAGLGLSLIVGQSGQISLGHGATLALGAYAQAGWVLAGGSALAGLPLAMFAGAAFGAIASLAARRLGGLAFGMSTLALALIVEEALLRLDGLTGGSSGLVLPPPALFGTSLATPLAQCLASLALFAVALLACRRLRDSRLGRSWRALREDEPAALAIGVDATRARRQALLCGGALGGLAGALYAHWLGYLSPEQFGLPLSFELLMLVFVGGARRLSGALWGALVMVALPQLLAALRAALPAALATLAGIESLLFGAVLVAMVLLRPGGLVSAGR